MPFLNITIWLLDGTLTSITTLGQSKAGSDSKVGYSTLDRFPELEPHYQMQFSVIHK